MLQEVLEQKQHLTAALCFKLQWDMELCCAPRHQISPSVHRIREWGKARQICLPAGEGPQLCC